MNKYILHIDANSAYLSWTAAQRLNNGATIDLRNVPSVVGGNEKSRHGIVLAKSIPAKKYGVQTGEPLMAARQKCPGLIVVPPSYSLFMKSSQAMYELINEFTPAVQRFSIDECFVEISTDSNRQEIIEVADELKSRIFNELGFTVNIGVSINKILAKMGSELKKPNMVHTVWPEEVATKIWPLPVGELFMVGRRTEKKLLNLGIRTIGELAATDTEMLVNHLKSFAYVIQGYARGKDDSPVRSTNRPIVKGMGNGTTAPFNVDNREEAHLFIMSLSESVAMRLREGKYCASLVAIGITSTEFVSKSRQRKLNVSVDSTAYISEVAKELFDELWDGKPVRKFRVRVSDLYGNDYVQLSLLEAFDFERQKKIDATVDNIRSRFGNKAIQKASFLHTGIKPVSGGVGDEEDYPMMTSIL